MGDNLTNAWLKAKSLFRFFRKYTATDRGPEGTEFYTLDFEDTFTGQSIDLSKWYVGQPWGSFHPENLHQYYGEGSDFVSVSQGGLSLFTRYKPKKFYNFKKSVSVTIPYGIGLVVSKRTFRYGYFEMEAMLPKGRFLWPALWLTAVKTWPPEIDILESYSGTDGNYLDGMRLRDADNQPNVHYGFTDDGTKSSYGGFSYPIPGSPTERFVRYGLHWTRDFIRVYYDGYLVFECTQKPILAYFNRPDVEMSLILNNALQQEAAAMKLGPSEFKVRSVRHFSN